MHDAIIEKITPYLGKAPNSECEVGYVLAEIRKLLERDRRQGSFGRLNFFCDWALHARLSRSTAREILLAIDDATSSARKHGNTDAVEAALSRVVTLEQFKIALDDFMQASGLSRIWTTQAWSSFVEKYCLIIQDCALEISDNPPRQPQHVRELVLRASKTERDDGGQIFEANWCVVYRDESVPAKNFTVYLWEDGGLGLASWI
ncbi:MAG: hypothetical protein ACYC92_08295 [Candidatus Acidiferrales bacterium]